MTGTAEIQTQTSTGKAIDCAHTSTGVFTSFLEMCARYEFFCVIASWLGS